MTDAPKPPPDDGADAAHADAAPTAAPTDAPASADAPAEPPGRAGTAAEPIEVAPIDPTPADADLDREPAPDVSGSIPLADEETLFGQAWRGVQTAGDAVYDVTRQVAYALGPASPYHRHDFIVIALAVAVVAAAGLVHRRMVAPTVETFSTRGLTFTRPATWLAPEEVPRVAPRLVAAPSPRPRPPGELPYHVAYTSTVDPDVRMEVRIEERPPWANVITSLELDRRTRWGELYSADGSDVLTRGRHSWLRTSFHYAYAPEKGDEPRIGHAIELATVDRERLYAVTLYGPRHRIARLAEIITPTLRVASLTGMPLDTNLGRLQPRVPEPVRDTFDRTVMVVVADVVDGRLRAVGGGSGAIIGGDGSVLTANHVLVDPSRGPHAVFLIARYTARNRPPELVCAGRPTASKLAPNLDLALVKCDLDLDGRPWSPRQSAAWPAITERNADPLAPGQRLWVLGYPDSGGGGLTITQGAVQGLTGEEGAADRYVKTDAVISSGNSGGPVVDDAGRLIGIASAYRIMTSSQGATVQSTKIGLVRPIGAADPIFAIVRAGWTPREGRTSIDLEPTAIEAEAEGIRLQTRIVAAANLRPVPGALLMVMRPGVTASQLDVNRLDDLVISWGRSGTDGEVYLKQPVPAPGTYTVMVTAAGYSPLIGDGALRLGADAPPYFDPWGMVKLER